MKDDGLGQAVSLTDGFAMIEDGTITDAKTIVRLSWLDRLRQAGGAGIGGRRGGP